MHKEIKKSFENALKNKFILGQQLETWFNLNLYSSYFLLDESGESWSMFAMISAAIADAEDNTG